MKIVLALCILLAFAFPAAATTEMDPINYCGGSLSLSLPDGWSASGLQHTPYGALLRASSHTGIKPGDAISNGEAYVVINIISRESMTTLLGIQPDSELISILRAVMRQAPADYKFESTILFTEGIYELANVEARGTDTDLHMYVVDLGASQVGVILFSSASGEMGLWSEMAFDLADTMHFSAPRFPAETDELTFPNSYSADDCSIAFAYPEGWTVERYGGSRMLITGMAGEMGEDQKATHSMVGLLWWNLHTGDVCEQLKLCAPDTSITVDSLFDTLEAQADAQRFTTLNGHAALLIRAPRSASDRATYVIRDGDRFSIAMYTADAHFTEYDMQVLTAVTNTMYFGSEVE